MISANGLGLHGARGLHYNTGMWKRFLLLMAGLPWMVAACPAQSDFFNHEGDEGWTRLDFMGQRLGSSFAVFEVEATDGRLPLDFRLGSIGGGGRYDNLTGVFGLKDVSGVG